MLRIEDRTTTVPRANCALENSERNSAHTWPFFI